MVPMRFILEDAREELNLYLAMHGLKPASMIGIRSGIKGLVYCHEISRVERICSSLFERHLRKKNIPFVNKEEYFLIGSNEQNLERLVNAKDDFETGMALGYPEDAVEYGES